jgi:hypothetical protein
LVKDTTKSFFFFPDGIKNLWNTGTGALKSRGLYAILVS